MAEYSIGGQRVVIDTSDSPSAAELQKRLEEALAQTQLTAEVPQETQAPTQQAPTQQAPVETEASEEDGASFVDHITEIPEGLASGATKAIANTSNVINDLTGGRFNELGDWLNDNVANLGYLHISDTGEISWTQDKVDSIEELDENAVEIFDTETMTGDITEGITQFVTGFLMTRGAGKAAGMGTGVRANVVYGISGEQLAFDPHEERLSNLVEQYPTLANPVTEYLAADPEDTEAEARFKMAIEALGMEGVGVALFSAIRGANRYRQGLKADPNDEKALQDWVDSQANNFDVSINELDLKMDKAVAAEAQLREIYKRADANADVLSPETIKGIKEAARKDAVSETDAPISTRGEELYGYGVTKTNDQLVREADDVLAEAFVDSPSVLQGIDNLKATIDVKDFDVYITAAGRVLQMTTRNMVRVNRELKIKEAGLADQFRQLDAKVDLDPAERMAAKSDLQAEFLIHQNHYRQMRNDYIDSVMAFRGAGTTAGRSVQVNKLFQNFDTPPHQVEKHFDNLLRNLPNDKVRNSFVARAVFALEQKGGNILKGLNEIFIANILTGFKTHVVNTASNSATALYLPAERIMAAGYRGIKGDFKGAQESFQAGIAQYTGMRHAIVESSKLAVEAFRIGDTLLDNNTTYESQGRHIIGRDLPFDKHTLAELGKFIKLHESEITLMDLLGTGMRGLSTRMLATEDEFFKNLNFRSKVWADSYLDGLKEAKGLELTGAEAKAHAKSFAQQSVDRASTEQMMLGKHSMSTDLGIEPYRADGLQYAREGTFTQDLGPKGKAFQNAVEQIPLARQLFPFVRTPLNLISASIQRSPLAPLSGRWRADLMAGGEREALAMTRLAVGSGVVATWMSDFAETGMVFEKAEEPQLLGSGPMNLALRQNQQELSNVVYGSIRMPDGTMYQISRLDPFSTIFEGMGVIQDLHRNGMVDEADSLSLTYGMALARMFGNDTYATSVRQMMHAMQSEKGLDKFLKQRVNQLMPLSGMVKGINSSQDPFMRELRSYTDSLRAAIPGNSESLAPRYNLLGEPVEATNYATLGVLPEEVEVMLSPIMTGKVTDDPVAMEVVNLGISTGKQRSLIHGGNIDLNNPRFATDAAGQPLYKDRPPYFTAFDRFNEILATHPLFEGQTLREYMGSTIASHDYQANLSNDIRITTPYGSKNSAMFIGGRKDILTAIISLGKEVALEILEAENKQLAQAILINETQKAQALTPAGQQQINLNSPLTGNQ